MSYALDAREDFAAHGGRFFEAIGTRFDTLDALHRVVPADVLDAWFDPAPAVIDRLREHLAFALRTSPPVQAGGLIEAIAEYRGLPPASLLTGGGSSDLIYALFPQFLKAGMRLATIRPSYGEYEHIARVLGAEVGAHELRENDEFTLDLREFAEFIRCTRPDVAVLVRPNNPVGGCIARGALLELVDSLPQTLFVIDEAYIEYAHLHDSFERDAAVRDNAIVLKSMSKVYALSGARAAYAVSSPSRVRSLRRLLPPWAVSLPGQIAAVTALAHPGYYVSKYAETRLMRGQCVAALRERTSVRIVESLVPAYLVRMPSRERAERAVELLESERIYVRSCTSFGAALERYVRVSVRSGTQNDVLVERIALLANAS